MQVLLSCLSGGTAWPLRPLPTLGVLVRLLTVVRLCGSNKKQHAVSANEGNKELGASRAARQQVHLPDRMPSTCSPSDQLPTCRRQRAAARAVRLPTGRTLLAVAVCCTRPVVAAAVLCVVPRRQQRQLHGPVLLVVLEEDACSTTACRRSQLAGKALRTFSTQHGTFCRQPSEQPTLASCHPLSHRMHCTSACPTACPCATEACWRCRSSRTPWRRRR